MGYHCVTPPLNLRGDLGFWAEGRLIFLRDLRGDLTWGAISKVEGRFQILNFNFKNLHTAHRPIFSQYNCQKGYNSILLYYSEYIWMEWIACGNSHSGYNLERIPAVTESKNSYDTTWLWRVTLGQTDTVRCNINLPGYLGHCSVIAQRFAQF